MSALLLMDLLYNTINLEYVHLRQFYELHILFVVKKKRKKLYFCLIADIYPIIRCLFLFSTLFPIHFASNKTHYTNSKAHQSFKKSRDVIFERSSFSKVHPVIWTALMQISDHLITVVGKTWMPMPPAVYLIHARIFEYRFLPSSGCYLYFTGNV